MSVNVGLRVAGNANPTYGVAVQMCRCAPTIHTYATPAIP